MSEWFEGSIKSRDGGMVCRTKDDKVGYGSEMKESSCGNG